jgi:hypothetical protein
MKAVFTRSRAAELVSADCIVAMSPVATAARKP